MNLNDYELFQKHVTIQHSAYELPQNTTTEKEIYKCNKEVCINQSFYNRSEFAKHLFNHSDCEVICINKNCSSTCKTYGAWRTHTSNYHRDQSYSDIKICYRNDNSNFLSNQLTNNECDNAMETDQITETLVEPNYLQEMQVPENRDDILDSDNSFEDLYMKTYLKYNLKYLVQSYVIEEIFNDIVEFVKINNQHIIDGIQTSVSNCTNLKISHKM